MSLKIGDYLFTGPFEIEKTLVRKNKAAVVYAIVCRAGAPWNPTFNAIAFGESGENGVVFSDHPERPIWESKNNGELGIYLLSEDELENRGSDTRQKIVSTLQSQHPEGSTNIPISGGQ